MTALIVVLAVLVALGTLAAVAAVFDELRHPEPDPPRPDPRLSHVQPRRRPFDFDRDFDQPARRSA